MKSFRTSPFLMGVKRRVRQLVKRDSWIPIGSVRWGDFRRQKPVCKSFGYSRGKPVDRYFIETFLEKHANDITGRVLEIKDAVYARRFGESRVRQFDVLDIDRDNSSATIVGDLGDQKTLERNAYDCIIVTQTLQYLIDPSAALRNIHKSLKNGGVLLLTAPGITPVRGSGHWYWNFTEFSVRRLLEDIFMPKNVTVRANGNLPVATAFLQGLSAAELNRSELEAIDPAYQVLIVARAVKSSK